MPDTYHRINFCNANALLDTADESVHLVVTSPPYPMIEMWDTMFCSQNGCIVDHLKNERGMAAFELMHDLLNDVWHEIDRVLVPGGISCINIGDATRTIARTFCLYPNNQKITEYFLAQGHLRKFARHSHVLGNSHT